MGVTVTRRGALPTALWDQAASAMVAKGVRDLIVDRAFVQGLGVDDQPHAPYSTRAITVSMTSETAARLKPKGGAPAYGRGRPRRLLVNGRPPRRLGWTATGARHYAGGYAAYKAASRRLRAAAQGMVDLTLSGQMRNSFKVKTATETLIVIGLTGEAVVYGAGVNAARRWIGISPMDREDIVELVQAASAAAQQRSRRGGR